jgi:hypothetical protein
VLLTLGSVVVPTTGVAAVARYPDQFFDPPRNLSIKVQRIDVGSSTAAIEVVLG